MVLFYHEFQIIKKVEKIRPVEVVICFGLVLIFPAAPDVNIQEKCVGDTSRWKGQVRMFGSLENL